MINLGFSITKPLLHGLDPETAHRITLRLLKLAHRFAGPAAVDPRISSTLWDLQFASPLGIAAGFDKDGEVPDAVCGLGFGFAEVGTVTPLPQVGNDRPRLFRLADERAVINRLGFNNQGHATLRARLAARQGQMAIVGVNIGANKDSPDRLADYVAGVEAFAGLAAYLTINISSPNTPGLRDLQSPDALAELLERCVAARDRQKGRVGRAVPLLLKVAPDLDDRQIEDIVNQAFAAPVDGCIVSNTTVHRDSVGQAGVGQAGGLSGRPLFRRSTIILARFRRAFGPQMPLIGVGGIDSGETAWQKVLAGANLLQLYTGLVYEGPGLVALINAHLAQQLTASKLPALTDAVGLGCERWASEDLITE